MTVEKKSSSVSLLPQSYWLTGVNPLSSGVKSPSSQLSYGAVPDFDDKDLPPLAFGCDKKAVDFGDKDCGCDKKAVDSDDKGCGCDKKAVDFGDKDCGCDKNNNR